METEMKLIAEEPKSWQEICKQKREQIQNLLPARWYIAPDSLPCPQDLKDATSFPRQYLSQDETDITESFSVEELLRKIADGHLSAVEVVEAFCHRATIAHQVTNCLSEVMFDQALADAKALDTFFRQEGRVIGPLHGLPVSLKDQFRVRDTETSLGFVAWLGRKETIEDESWIVKELRRLGAVVYVKTNVPTSLMAIETNNNIIGYTTNATNRLLSAGGSSGGEASLIAMGGSILGLGSDIGASIRLPCGLNGIVGLKPSHGRLPALGTANSMEGHRTLEPVVGPMGRSVPDLRLLTKLILETEPWRGDPKVICLPWRSDAEELIKRKIASCTLNFAAMRCDGLVTPHPPVLRVLEEAIQSLRTQGYEVIDWEPPAHADGFSIAWDAFTADAGADIHSTLSASGEVPVPELAISYGESFGHLPSKTVNDLWELERRKDHFQNEYLKYWESISARTHSGFAVDAIILPITPVVGYKRGNGEYAGYTAVFNVLDYSVVAIRGGKVDAVKDKVAESFSPLSDQDAKLQGQYDPDLFDQTPVGLQIVCRRLEEEKVLAIAEEVQRVLTGIEHGNGTEREAEDGRDTAGNQFVCLT